MPKSDKGSAKGLEATIGFHGIAKEKKVKVLKRASKEMRFVSLHHHSTYSYLDGYGHPREHIERAAELGMTAMALTEHGNVSSHPKLEMAAQEIGVKPIFGCELYCGPPEPRQTKNHLTVLAESEIGYQNLMSTVTWGWNEGFYYKPTVHGNVLADHREGLIVLSGCLGSLLASSLIGGKGIDEKDAGIRLATRVARSFKECFGDSYYIEVQTFPDLEATKRVNPALAEIANRLKIPLVGTSDVHYCRPEDAKVQAILHAVRPDMKKKDEGLDELQSWEEKSDMSHPRSDKMVLERLMGTGLTKKQALQAIDSTNEIAQRCSVVLPKAAPLRYPEKVNWRALLHFGWTYRDIENRPDRDRYAEQLAKEVAVIEEKKYVDYFLIVSDMVQWAKDNGIFVGPGRGSAAASLVCYLLRITEVDPMIFPDLVFERFIDYTREDLPDIDLDFDDERRHEVYEYLGKRYGQDHVGQLGTFTTYKSKLALDDVAHVYGIPKYEVEIVKELLIERSSGDLRSSATIEDTIEMFAEVREVVERHPNLMESTRLEGMVKGMGTHAAGVIVSSEPLTKTCAVYRGSISVDKYDAEHLNLLKIDNLGLKTCGMLEEAIRLAGMSITDLYRVPLDDEDTIRGFHDGDLVGIFQFDGRAMRLVNNALKPDNFYEVCAVNALARPGPLHNNATTHYVDIKYGKIRPETMHPIFDEIVKTTQYQVVYQEQILRIVREIGKFDWTAAAYIRKIISRKIGEQEFNRQWNQFWRGAKSQGIDRETAQKIWGMCITAGSYAFNAAHSVSYGLLGYWTMYMKRHYPLIFFLSALRRLPEHKNLEIMRDAVKHGIKVLPPQPNESGVTWEARDGKILAGFAQIPGIGDKMGLEIVKTRENLGGFDSWDDLIEVKGIGLKKIAGYLTWVQQEDPLGVNVLDKKLKSIVRGIKNGKIRGRNNRRLPIPTHTSMDVPYGRGQDVEVVWIGVCVARNLRDLFEVNFSRTGVPLDPKEVKHPELREWVLLYGTDGDDMLTFNISRFQYQKFKEMVWSLKLGRDIVLIRGVKKGFTPHKIVYVSEMVVIE